MDQLLQAMRAVAEPTRLRILNLCAHSELTVSDLVGLLGQSQPRLSRHLKLLVEGGLLERYQEGSWARYRIKSGVTPAAGYGTAVLDLLPLEDPILARDLDRLDRLREKRDAAASEYFKRNADQWDEIRALHVDEEALSRYLSDLTRDWPLGRLLDIGTGTGKLLELFGPRSDAATGIDMSPDMLRIARAAVEREGLAHCQVRQADMYQLPHAAGEFNTAVFHMVLHYAEDPVLALSEAARVLTPNGRLLIVDFEKHDRSDLVSSHAHRWLGFGEQQMTDWLEAAGYSDIAVERLQGGSLTLCVWTAKKRAARLEAVG